MRKLMISLCIALLVVTVIPSLTSCVMIIELIPAEEVMVNEVYLYEPWKIPAHISVDGESIPCQTPNT